MIFCPPSNNFLCFLLFQHGAIPAPTLLFQYSHFYVCIHSFYMALHYYLIPPSVSFYIFQFWDTFFLFYTPFISFSPLFFSPCFLLCLLTWWLTTCFLCLLLVYFCFVQRGHSLSCFSVRLAAFCVFLIMLFLMSVSRISIKHSSNYVFGSCVVVVGRSDHLDHHHHHHRVYTNWLVFLSIFMPQVQLCFLFLLFIHSLDEENSEKMKILHFFPFIQSSFICLKCIRKVSSLYVCLFWQHIYLMMDTNDAILHYFHSFID